MDFETARFNMVEQQIRPWDVTDAAVLDLMREVPREKFVAESRRSLAFADLSLPIGRGETMWQPKIEARVLQALRPSSDSHVLEVGTGSGYLTALLASCSKHVTSIDIYPDFIGIAEQRLSAENIKNVSLMDRDGAHGWQSSSTWDIIVLTGSVPTLPPAYQNMLSVGGRLVAIVGTPPVMEAILFSRDEGSWVETSLFETMLQPFINARPNKKFNF